MKNIISLLFLFSFFHFSISQTSSNNCFRFPSPKKLLPISFSFGEGARRADEVREGDRLLCRDKLRADEVKYWIQFKDKNSSPFSLKNPSVYLSQKAIDRRNRQNIHISISDLPVNPIYVSEIKAMGVTIINQSKWFNAITVSTSDSSIITSIRELKYVENVKKMEKSQTLKVPSKFVSESIAPPATLPSTNAQDKPSEGGAIPSSSNVLNYGSSFKQANQIGVDCLHNLGYMGQGITIAVLDAGFFDVNVLPAFDSLRMNNQLLGTRDFVSGDTMVFEDFPHGMNVLSCMVANLPGKIIGTAPKAKYWLLRTEDANSESISEEINWLVGAEFADSVGADIINSSLGYTRFDNPVDNHSYSDMDGNTTIITKAADWAASKGILVVSSAGNSGGPPWYKIVAPADADSILTVGAVDSAGFIASLSSRGPTFDGRIKPNTVARGLQAVIAANTGDITTSSGTSFSSPITAGAVACLWQANPSATNMQLIDAIQQSSSQFLNPDSIKGYGIPNFCAANTILTGIDIQDLEDDNLNVYPNPFSNNFYVTFYSVKKQLITIELYDISGRVIFKKQENISANSYNTFNTEEVKTLSNGLYLLRVITPDSNYCEKLFKK